MASLAGLHPQLRPWAELLVNHYRLTVTSGYRSYSEQLELWRNRRNNPFPVAPPGQSYHGYGRAFDVSGPLETLRAAGRAWRSIGGTWSETDVIHFQA